MIVGLDYNSVEFQYLDLSRAVTIGISGREKSGKTNLAKLIFDYCLSAVFDYPTKAYIIDDYSRQLNQFSSYGFVERYTVDATALDVILPEIEDELKHRKAMLQENGPEFLDQEPLIICAIENQAVFENGTLSKQTIEVFKRIITSYIAATMGVVPYKLTQVVLQLCLALGESANDIRLMEKGQKVALIKSSDTWTLSPSGAINAAKDVIKDEVTEQVQQIAGSAKGVVSDLIDAGTEKIEVKATDYISDMTIAINSQAEELIGSMFSAFEEEAVASLDSFLKQGKEAVGNVDATAQAVINNADAKAKEIINSSSDTVKPILQGFYDLYLSPKLGEMKSEIKTALGSIDNIEDGSTILLNVQKKIASMIEDSLTNLSSYVQGKTSAIIGELRNKLVTTADGYIDMAANEILDVTNNFLDETFDSVASQLPDIAGKPTNNSSLASIIKFNYGDYLKMFVFLKLCVDDADVISRIADVIQLNINQALADSGYTHPVKGSFLMSEAYTYIQIDAKVKLKTMFISLPFFTEYSEKGGSYFTIDYKSVLGY